MADWLTVGSFWTATLAAIASIAAVVVSYYAVRTQVDPDVIVYAKHDTSRPSIIVIIIENVGRGIAYDVRFTCSRSIPAHAFGIEKGGDEPPKGMDVGPFLTGIPVLAPGDQRVITWGQFGGISDALADHAIDVEASFKRSKKGSWRSADLRTHSTLEVGSFEGTDASEPPEVRQVRELANITRALEASQRHIKTIADIISKPEIEALIQRVRSQQARSTGADPKAIGSGTEGVPAPKQERKHGA
jgi:hypothetical protein